jgi:hypothetical protein
MIKYDDYDSSKVNYHKKKKGITVGISNEHHTVVVLGMTMKT